MASLNGFTLVQTNKTHITLPHNFFHKSLKPYNIFKSTSSPYITSSLKPHKSFQSFIHEKLVGIVIGTVVFVGCVNITPAKAAAMPPQQTSISESSEEEDESGTHKGKGRSDEVEMCERVLEREAGNVEALKVVVYGKMRRGETKEAVRYVERLIGIEPEEVEWRMLRALCHEIMGELGTAKKLFQEILEERPLLLRALHGLALVMHKKREGPAVFVMLDKALKIAQREKRVIEERNIRILMAQMHVVKGQLEEGLNLFQDLMDEDPRDFRPYLCQGIIYSLRDQKKEAAEKFEIYRALVPEEVSQKGFLDDVVLAAKMKPAEQLKKEFDSELSNQKCYQTRSETSEMGG